MLLGQNVAMCALPTARNLVFVLILAFLVHSPSFFLQNLTLLKYCVRFGEGIFLCGCEE